MDALSRVLKFIWMLRAIFYKPFMHRFGWFSYIGPTCYLSGVKHFSFGDRVRIYPNARVESLGGTIEIGNNVSIGQNLHIVSVNNVRIGKDTTISSNVFVSDVDHQYEALGVHIMEQPLDVKSTHIGDNCFIGYGSVIMPGTILGKHCIVGANSVVKGIFPDYCVIAGSPARIIKYYDSNEQCWVQTSSKKL
ncbi:acyltransferase [Vibrio crassostreae]|uniref:acyltransferase n=1 Tax=Vibrio crassostreae TaxID=246167 RepID=UPI002E18211E|nr:acyltransferase [Vibrio crassostreae]